jgi:hypothetical protein
MEKKRPSIYLPAVLVAFSSFAVYLNALHNGFLNWDDGTYVTGNIFLRSIDAAFFKWAFFGSHASNWHPLTWLSHAADYRLWGLNPRGHHLTSIILHAFNAFLVTVLTGRLMEVAESRAEPPRHKSHLLAATVTGLLFGLHPLHVESVAWVAERKDLLCALFFLLSILAYLDFARAKGGGKSGEVPALTGKWWYGAALAFFLLALLSKPMAVSLPLVLLILDWYPLDRIVSARTLRSALLEKLPFICLSLGSSLITYLAQKGGGALAPMASVPLSMRLPVAIKSLAVYLGKVIMPINLVPFYPYPKHGASIWLPFAASAVVVAAITTACVVAARKQQVWLAAWSCYVVTLIPVLGIIQVGNQAMADRYTYLPGIGPMIIAGLGVAWGYAKLQGMERRSRGAAVAGGCAIVLVMVSLAVATWKQSALWHDSIRLWSYVIDRNYGDEQNTVNFSFVYNNRGVAYHAQHELDKAIADYSRAIELDPGDYSYYLNRATAYAEKKLYDEALADNRKSFEIHRAKGAALYNIACIYALKNDPEQACSWLRKSIDQGYADWEQVRHDTDLDSIRNSPCYQSLVTGR